MMNLWRLLKNFPLSLKFRTRMNSPLTGRPMTGIFFFVEGTFNWDFWLEKKIKEVREKLTSNK